jgi:pectin methylesterase-like acyl-CoA thioesterase
LDADGDGLTNLEEYLAGSDPIDAGSPSATFFVSTSGADAVSGGTRDAPWASIGFALSAVVASPSNPVRINVSEGFYTEDLALRPWVTIAAVLGDVVTIEGAILGASDSRLIDLELTNLSPAAAILDMDDARMEVLGVVFRGEGDAMRQVLLCVG